MLVRWLCVPLAWYTIQALCLSFNLRYGISPDEDHHFRVIQAFSHTFAVRLEDSADTWRYGSLSVWPYLFHRLFGFLDMAVRGSAMELLVLRLFNVLLSVGYLIVAAHLCTRVTANKTVQFTFLMVLANIPMLQLLGGAVSYDNLVNLLSALLVLQVVDFWREPMLRRLLWIGSTTMLGSLTKITFVPWAVIIVPVVAYRYLSFKIGLRLSSTSRKVVSSALLFLVCAVACIDLYGRNVAEYGQLFPYTEQVLGEEKARLHYDQFRRNEQWAEEGRAQPAIMNPSAWFGNYLYLAAQGTLGIQAHRNYGREKRHLYWYLLTCVPLLCGLAALGTPRFRRQVAMQTNWDSVWLCLWLGISYAGTICILAYKDYLEFRIFGRGIQGRYLFPAFAPLLAVAAAISIAPWNRVVQKLCALGICGVFLILGWSYIVRDKRTWSDLLAPGAVWSDNLVPIQPATKPVIRPTITLSEQSEREDGQAATNSRWYAQKLVSDGDFSKIDGVELFLVRGGEYHIAIHSSERDTLGSELASTSVRPEESGKQFVALEANVKGPAAWLVIKGLSTEAADFGTSAPNSDPYVGPLMASADSGVTWTQADRDAYFKVLRFAPNRDPDKDGVLEIGQGPFGDTKLLPSSDGTLYAVSSLRGKLIVARVQTDGTSEVSELPISADWLDVGRESESTLVIAASSFQDHTVRVHRLQLPSLAIEPTGSMAPACDLAIDPTLARAGEEWLLGVTEINGTVNRRSLSDPPGKYRVSLHRSNDLVEWSPAVTVVEGEHNIEDTQLLVSPSQKQLYLLYEIEALDGGPSSINVALSSDGGKSWPEHRELVNDGSDNEPAALVEVSEGLTLFFSSDRESKGRSYQGGKGYALDLSKGSLQPGKVLWLATPPRILLSDVVLRDEHSYYFAALQDYSENRKLLISSRPLILAKGK